MDKGKKDSSYDIGRNFNRGRVSKTGRGAGMAGACQYCDHAAVWLLHGSHERAATGQGSVEEQIPYRYLSGNLQPEFWTLADFRKDHLQERQGLFVEFGQVL